MLFLIVLAKIRVDSGNTRRNDECLGLQIDSEQ